MYKESQTDDLFSVEIRCDKCSNNTILAGTESREFYMQLLYDLGWRLNSTAKKYFQLCSPCAKKELARRRNKRAGLAA